MTKYPYHNRKSRVWIGKNRVPHPYRTPDEEYAARCFAVANLPPLGDQFRIDGRKLIGPTAAIDLPIDPTSTFYMRCAHEWLIKREAAARVQADSDSPGTEPKEDDTIHNQQV